MNNEVNGKILEYGDCVINNVTCSFGWRDRVRILFGMQAVVTVRTYTKDVVEILETETDLRVNPIILYAYPVKKISYASGEEIPMQCTSVPAKRIIF